MDRPRSERMVCVDASVVVKWLVDEADSDAALDVFDRWCEAGAILVAPSLLEFEVYSVLRRLSFQGRVSPERAREGVDYFHALGIETRTHPLLLKRAWELAVRFQRPTIYDTTYVALAEIEGCHLYTCDNRLLNAVGHSLRWVKPLPATNAG
ncbi:MAG: type II toxin-antitoxin system VapC family toxin [Bacillota bacterium]